MSVPSCGCIAQLDAGTPTWYSDGCLYGTAVSRVTELEGQIRQAKEVINAFILSQSWQGSPEVKAAELFLSRLK